MTVHDDRTGPGLAGASPGQSVLLAVTGPVMAAVVFAVIAIGVALLLRVVAPGG